MATVTLMVPNEMLRKAKARLNKRGQDDIQEYLLCAIQSLAMEGQPIDKETAAKLIEGVNSPLLKMSEDDWNKKLRRFDQRHRKRART